MAKKTKDKYEDIIPMLKTVSQMSRISGIGENKLRQLMEQGELEYLLNGNRKLLREEAIWDWYERNKISPMEVG